MSEDIKNKAVETFGAPLSPNDARDYRAKVAKDAEKDYPEEFDLFEGMNIEVKNQHSVNSCVAHALATAIEYFHEKQKKEHADMSTGYIYGNREYTTWGGEGLYVRDALKTVSKCGDAFFADMSFNLEIPDAVDQYNSRNATIDEIAYHNRISAYYKLSDTDSIKEQLMRVGPVIFAVDWHPYTIDKWHMIHWKEGSKSTGGHCMVIRGWNKDGWLVQNSWGTFWGNKGTCIFPYSMKLREVWGVSDDIVGETGALVVSPVNQFIKAFYKVFNLFWDIVYFFKRKKK